MEESFTYQLGNFLRTEGMQHERTISKTPQQNLMVKWRGLTELSSNCLGQCYSTPTFEEVFGRVSQTTIPQSSNGKDTIQSTVRTEIYCRLSVSFWVWSIHSCSKRQSEKQCVFLVYSDTTKGYQFYNL